jgi:hypothetical protein
VGIPEFRLLVVLGLEKSLPARGKLPLSKNLKAGRERTMDSLVAQILENFKAAYGLKITDSSLFITEKSLLEFLMKLGGAAMGGVFQ